MRILIVVTNYLNKRVSSSKRWRCISRELAKRGHLIDVIAEDNGVDEDLNECKDLDIGYLKVGSNKETATVNKEIEYGTTQSFCIFRLGVYYLRDFYEKKRSQKIAGEIIQKRRLRLGTYDFVVCSVQNIEAFYLAYFLIRKGVAKRMVCDVRDRLSGLIYGRPELDIIGGRQIRKIAKSSEYIFAVNGGICKWIYNEIKETEKEIFIFPHGIDPIEDMIETGDKVRTHVEEGERLIISYTGSCYPGLRCIEPLFDAIKKVGEDKVRLIIAGKSVGEFHMWAAQYGMENIIDDRGYTDKLQAIRIQEESDILFYPTYIEDDSEYCGMSGKFPEYLASGKMVISIINAPHGSSWYIRETDALQLGFCCDAEMDGCSNRLAKFIRKAIDMKKNGNMSRKTESVEMDKYKVERIAKEMEVILTGENARELDN